MKTPIYTTAKCHAVQKPKRRRLGELSHRLASDLRTMDKHTATACKIGAAMLVASITNPLNF